MGKGRNCRKMEGLVMVIVQIGNTGLNVFYKLASNDGMSLTVMVAYRFLFASAFMLPLALFLEWKIRPKLTWVVVLLAFFCGLLGGPLAQNLYAKTLVLTSATFASAMTNLIPVMTFVMAVSFGLETLGLRTMQGKTKVLGTLGSIGGALLLTLYKGPHIDMWSTHVDLLPKGPHSHGHVADSHQFSGQQMWGALLAVLGCCSCALSLIIQEDTTEADMGGSPPSILFVMAVSFGLETLGSMQGKAKVLGTLGSIGGALLLTLYKGPHIDMWSTHVDLLPKGPHSRGHVADSHQFSGQQMWGALLAVLGCCSCALSLIIQAKMSEGYPCYSSTALIAVMGSIQAVVFALITERDWNQWKLGWNIRLLSVAYSGIMASGVMFILVMWCIKRKGPLFVSIFSPLMLVFTAIAGSLVLEEKLHLGSVLGAFLIVSGLYGVLWAKGKETKKNGSPPLLIPLRISQQIDFSVPTSTENSSIATNPSNCNSSSSSNVMMISNSTARANT